jgi:SAM-dependent methyltransferase
MPDLLAPRAPSALVERFYRAAEGNRALDLACGGGRHTIFLSEKGFRVDAVDISDVALAKLAVKVDTAKVRLIESDLDRFSPGAGRYDLIVMTNFLDRALIRKAADAVKRGGVIIIETYMFDPANEKKDSNPDFLLEKEELKTFFDKEWEVLAYEEFWNEAYEKYRMRKQGIAVRKCA